MTSSCFYCPLPAASTLRIGAGDQFVEAGETAWINGRKAPVLTITNPYETGSVDFICAWIALPELNDQPPVTLPFDLTTTNTLHTLFCLTPNQSPHRQILGRMDSTFKQAKATPAFLPSSWKAPSEFKERLLLQRDGLALNAVTEADFEALSDGAIILILEV